MRADVVAAPVAERVRGRRCPAGVLGGSTEVAYLSLQDFVVALTAPGVPLMPNGVAVDRSLHGLVSRSAGRSVEIGAGAVVLGGEAIRWDPTGVLIWEPRPPVASSTPAAVRTLGVRLLAAFGLEPSSRPDRLAAGFRGADVSLAHDLGGRLAITALLEAVLHRDASAATRASRYLAGRGGGLTPEGDDLLAAVATAVALLGPAVGGFPVRRRQAWLDGLRHGARARATTALASTLLELACRGQVAEPLHGVLSADPHSPSWKTALARLQQIGNSTGVVYGLGLGAAAALLSSTTGIPADVGDRSKEAARC